MIGEQALTEIQTDKLWVNGRMAILSFEERLKLSEPKLQLLKMTFKNTVWWENRQNLSFSESKEI
jgi:hypothetical protein